MYQTIEQDVKIAGENWRLMTLADRQQFHDPDGDMERAGVSPAAWSLFGVVWSAGVLLAETMATEPLAGRAILELGCGLGLASMVVAKRGGNITASDVHPLAERFLSENCTRNHLGPIPFRLLDWRDEHHLPAYELIIGSDLLYERGQPQTLADFIRSHGALTAEIILTDPGRKQVATMTRLLVAMGFDCTLEAHGKARLVRYRRSIRDQVEASSTT